MGAGMTPSPPLPCRHPEWDYPPPLASFSRVGKPGRYPGPGCGPWLPALIQIRLESLQWPAHFEGMGGLLEAEASSQRGEARYAQINSDFDLKK